jgi:hypothetical protein
MLLGTMSMENGFDMLKILTPFCFMLFIMHCDSTLVWGSAHIALWVLPRLHYYLLCVLYALFTCHVLIEGFGLLHHCPHYRLCVCAAGAVRYLH